MTISEDRLRRAAIRILNTAVGLCNHFATALLRPAIVSSAELHIDRKHDGHYADLVRPVHALKFLGWRSGLTASHVRWHAVSVRPQVRKLYKSSAVAWVTAASADGKSLDPQTTFAALRPVILLLLLSALSVETFAENAICILRSLHTFVLEDMTFTPGLAGTIAGILGDKARSAARNVQSRTAGWLTGRRARTGGGGGGGGGRSWQLLTANWPHDVQVAALSILQQLAGVSERIHRETPVPCCGQGRGGRGRSAAHRARPLPCETAGGSAAGHGAAGGVVPVHLHQQPPGHGGRRHGTPRAPRSGPG